MRKSDKEDLKSFSMVFFVMAMFIVLGILGQSACNRQAEAECRGLGGTPVVYQLQHQCWPGGVR
jgi:hypothetical protein